MFDVLGLFGPTPDQLQKANEGHYRNFVTLIILLLEKGVFTTEEFERATIKATHITDQVMKKGQEDHKEEFEKKFPGFSKLFGLGDKDKKDDGGVEDEN